MRLGFMSKVFKVLSEVDFSDYSDNDAINEVLHLFHYSPRVLNNTERDYIIQLRKICSEYGCSLEESMKIFDLCANVLKKGCRPGNCYSSDNQSFDGIILSRSAFHDLLEGYVKRAMVEHYVQQTIKEGTDLIDRKPAEEQPKKHNSLTGLFHRLYDIEDDLRLTKDVLSIINNNLIDNHGSITEKMVEETTSGLLVVEERLQKVYDDLCDLHKPENSD